MPYGYHGRILIADLTRGQLTVDEPGDDFYRTYMGGTNFGMYYILKHMPAGADPLGPDNVLTLMLSVLTGMPFSGQSRMTANAKSPLTGAIGDIECDVVAGGHLAHRQDGQCGVGALPRPVRSAHPVAGNRDEVAEERVPLGRRGGGGAGQVP